MKKTLALLVPLVLLYAIASLASPPSQVEGIIVDQACAADHLTDGNGYTVGKAHTRDCALMTECVKSGYGVFTEDGKYLKFDAAGNQKAEAALRSSDKKNDIHVKVTGEQKDGVLAVESLSIL